MCGDILLALGKGTILIIKAGLSVSAPLYSLSLIGTLMTEEERTKGI